MASSPQNPSPTAAAAAAQQPPLPPPAPSSSAPVDQSKAPPQYKDPILHNVALGLTPIAMMALFLPPRRLDVRQLLLGGTALWGTNQLMSDWTGKSFGERMSQRASKFSEGMASFASGGTALPEKALRTQALLRQEREKLREQGQKLREQGLQPQQNGEEEERRGQKGDSTESKEERGVLEAIWMGDQDADWKAKRDQREREALQEGGGGYWSLIADQLSEVWNGTKKEQGAKDAEAKAKADANEGKKP